MSGRTTMRDVAKAAGVSPMTVSRALRGDTMVNQKTRDLVQNTAARLGYVYDTTAQAFRSQKSGFVAVTLPSINNANFADTFRGLSETFGDLGLQLLLGSTNYDVEAEEHLVRHLLQRRPEAVILTGGYHTDATQQLLRAANVPIFEIWDLPDNPLGHVVGFSNADAMKPLVQHLAKTGRRKLAFVGVSEGTDHRGAERRRGVVDTAQSLGLPDVQFVDAGQAPVSMTQGADAVRALGSSLNDLDALVCVSDPVAYGALSACQRMGIRVPNDLAITGFGAFEIASVCVPSITTVRVNAHAVGVRVGELALRVFDGQDTGLSMTEDLGSSLQLGETS
ncbi:MAG: LacI family DNA-binding transcriptional regulator [Paracoccaceae bacterium]